MHIPGRSNETESNMNKAAQVLIETTDWESYESSQLALAFLAVMPDSPVWMMRLLDVVLNDARDGLLTACWYRDDAQVNEKLLQKFEEWSKDPTWGGGDGEDYWLARFVSKWSEEGVFSPERLGHLKMWCVEHGIDIPTSR